MSRRMWALTIVAAVVAGAGVGWLGSTPRREAPKSNRVPALATREATPDLTGKGRAPVFTPPEVRDLLARLPEPSRSPFLTRAEQAALLWAGYPDVPRLTGTLVSLERKIAWFDDRPRIEGERVGKYWVERIEPGRAFLRFQDELLPVEISPDPDPEEPTEAQLPPLELSQDSDTEEPNEVTE